MSDNTHTPGPWEVKTVDHGDLVQVDTINAPNAAYSSRNDMEVVAPGGIWGRSLGECNANAALIAAAPDMLAALDSVISAQDDANGTYDDFVRGQMAAIETARAAIAKARA